MALIQCPHCGERVSDTVERCIHCGKPILKKESKMFATDFYALGKDKRQSFEAEFQRGHTKYMCPYAKQKALKCRRKSSVFSGITCVAGVIFFILLILVKTKVLDINNDDTLLMIVMPIVLVVVLVILICVALRICYTIKSKRLIVQYLLYEKLYQVWLLNEKNVSKKVDFTGLNKKDKKYFENINPDLYL